MITLVAFQGPSGSGKTTLQEIINLKKVVSYTSRKIRPRERHGVDYHFTTEEDLRKMDSDGKLLELSHYNGNWYATTKASIDQSISQLQSIVVEQQGMSVLRDYMGEKLLSIGVYAPYEDCVARLGQRIDSNAASRLRSYEFEIKQLYDCDIVINNDKRHQSRACAIIHMIRETLMKKE